MPPDLPTSAATQQSQLQPQPPPTVTKRKKHLEKRASTASSLNESNPNVSNASAASSVNHPMMFHYHQSPVGGGADMSRAYFEATGGAAGGGPAAFSFPGVDAPAYYGEPMSLPMTMYRTSVPTTMPTTSSTNPFSSMNGMMGGGGNGHGAGGMYPMSLGSMHHLLPGSKMPYFDTSECKSLPIFDQTDEMLKRRFSDPGLPNDSDSSLNSFDGKLLQKLSQQVHVLKDSNRKLYREMAELRLEVGMLKQQVHARHFERDFERDYEPGMLADIVREMRDASRVRDDTLLSRVKHLIEEKQLSMNHFNLLTEKNRHNDRLSKLEDQMKSFSLNNNNSHNTSRQDDSSTMHIPNIHEGNTTASAARQIVDLEQETLLLRRELQEARARKDDSDRKMLQLDKKLQTYLRGLDNVGSAAAIVSGASEVSDDGKSIKSESTALTSANLSRTSSSSVTTGTPTPTTIVSTSSVTPQRITLSGPVTDL